jgi:competence protein ComEC
MRSAFEVRAPELTMALAASWLGGLVCSTGVAKSGSSALGIAALALATLIAAIALASGVGGALVPKARARSSSSASRLAAVALLLTAWLAGAALPPPATPRPPPFGLARLELEVLEATRARGGAHRATVRVLLGERVQDRAVIETGLLMRVGPAALTAGTRVRVLGQVSAATRFRNPTPHPPWPARHELAARVWVTDGNAIEVLDAASPRAWLERARQHVMRRLEATLPSRTAGVALALVLGEGAAVSPSDDEAVRGAGLAHVFAVSGLHVVLVVGALVELLRRLLLRVPQIAARFEARRIASALGVPLALAYAAFAGGAPSAWRAAAMAGLGWTLIALGKKPRGAAVAAYAVLLLGSLDPREALRPGFMLSVLATAAILAQPPAGATLAGQLALAVRIAVATTLATAPLVLWCFGALPLIGVLANLLLAPVGSFVLLPVATVHALLAALGFESALTAHALTLGCDAFLNTAAALTRWSPPWTIPPPDVPQGIVLCLAVAALFCVRRWQGAVRVLAIAALAIAGCEHRLRACERPTDLLRATFLDVGQGDAALIDLPDGRLMLVDAGGNPGGGVDPGSAVLVPLLHARRRTRVDIAVITHPHPDHYGGLAAVLEGFPMGELWDSGQAEAELGLDGGIDAAAELLARARSRGAKVRKPAELCGRPIVASGVRISVLAPCPTHDPGLDANDNSLVLRIEYRGRSMLLMGDAETHEEAALLADGAALRADVLKVGHHGSRTSSSAALLSAAKPSVAIISAGAANRFGHPHAEVLERLRGVAPHVLALSDTGGVVVTIDDDGDLDVAPLEAPSFEL